MNISGPAQASPSKRLKIAIYDTPAIMGRTLSDTLTRAGFDVIFEGKLNRLTARSDADVWLNKWSFLLKRDFLNEHHPRLGIITMSVGTEHIDRLALQELGLKLDNCPTFSSNSVAEHAIALSFRGIYGAPAIPSVGAGPLVFSNFSDDFAERVVAHMLLRGRQMEDSMLRARGYDYLRHDGPWRNEELSGTKVGIIGQDRDAFLLARMLGIGFNCDMMGFDTSEELDGYGVRPTDFSRLADEAQYLFLCTDRFGMLSPRTSVDAREIRKPDLELTGAKVAVLGTGRIGSMIAKMCRLGFGCDVVAYDTSHRQNLLQLGVKYVDSVEDAIRDTNFIFIALPLNEGTKNLITGAQMALFRMACSRVLINVTRDQILESKALFDYISRGAFLAYGTDVLPNDVVLWSGGEPDDITKQFVQHGNVVATPHEAECSRESLKRLCSEVIDRLSEMLRIFN